MFENWKRQRKINAFRRGEIKVIEYNPESRIIELTANSFWKAELGFDLFHFDGKLQLAFSGGEIVLDGEVLSRIMQTMWNEELPLVFSSNEELQVQLGKKNSTSNGDDETAYKLEPESPQQLYFRDMSEYVMGKPTYVHATVDGYFMINR